MLNLTGNQGMAKINDIFKDLKDAGIVFPLTLYLIHWSGPLQKSDGSWKMTVDHSKVNQVVVLIADVASFLEYINMFSGT